MNEKAKKAYKTYQSCVKQLKTVKRVTKQDLNTLYNIQCRMKKDSEYAEQLRELSAENESFCNLIENFFGEYNNFYGLEIRDDLIEFDDPEFASGSYFIIKSYKKDDTDNLVELAPTEFKANEEAFVRATLYSHESNSPIVAERLLMLAVTDEGEEIRKETLNTDTMEFTTTLSRPGYVKFKVLATDSAAQMILGSETAFGGIIFSREEIKTAHEPPSDLYDFWDGEIKRLMDTDPTDTTSDVYTGEVETLFDMPAKNKYSLKRIDKEYVEWLKSNSQPAPDDTQLEQYNIYELVLKSPGPCPSTGYVSIPKSANAKALPIHVSYDGYSVRSPAPMMKPDCIAVHCSHHGYILGQKDAEFYNEIRKTVGGAYCLGNGEPNSRFDNVHDCYPLYIMLRDLQMIRYLIDPTLSNGIEGLHYAWNGDIILWGGSMGGYQTLCVGALMPIMKKYCPPYRSLRLEAGSPAFGDVAGHTAGRVKSTFFTYSKGVDYFDTAILSSLISDETLIHRASLGDEVCTASSMTAMYNMIPGDVKKEIRYVQNSSHGYLPDEEHQTWYVYKNK
ncbi:MAG: hypothetical protein E7612_09600 [Ruminococcaceae bacterium]|nr:hypothetical protein [Oscillospiraceae bacterium]